MRRKIIGRGVVETKYKEEEEVQVEVEVEAEVVLCSVR